MNRSEIATAVIARISRVPAETLSADMELVADLDMDSARAFELLVELEDQLDIEISDDTAAKFNTVGDILEFIGRL